jgi:NAD(P)-dependent dehydrogenase (short-subunit alcohol dehydrogenase family)
MSKPAFEGRGFLITGGASGIGLASARLLKVRGARLVLWDQNAAALEQAASELNAHHATVDITRPEKVLPAMDDATRYLGALDGVLHSAGILRTGLFEEVDVETHRRTLEVNLFGTLLMAHAALPYLRASHGSLILMCSVAAFHGPPEYSSYGASKAGVLTFAQALRVELAGTGVHVGVVSPNSVNTPMLDAHNRQSRFNRRLGIPHTADDVAKVILAGIAQRRFMIWPSQQPRLIFWLSRVLNPPLSHAVMLRVWRWAGGSSTRRNQA